MEEDPPDRRAAPTADLAGHVPRNRFPLAVRVSRNEDLARLLRGALQVGECLLLAGDGDILGLEPTIDVDAELLLGEVADVADSRLHLIGATEILADGLGLRRGFDDDERAPACGCGLSAIPVVRVLAGGGPRLPGSSACGGPGGALAGGLLRSGLAGRRLPGWSFHLMDGGVFRTAVLIVPGALHQRTEVLQCDAAVDLAHGALDHMLELGSVQHSRAIQRQKVAPGLGRESSPLVRAKDAKC